MTLLAPTATDEELRAGVEFAVEHLGRGEVVALPTETVYGLAADALRPDAVVKIFEAKDRPWFDPLIVHLPDRAALEETAQIPFADRDLANRLVERFWPGPLTLVLPRRPAVPDLVTAGLETVAVRMSAHPVFRAIIERFGKPLAAPSANRFGRISPTTALHVQAELGGRIPLIIDAGSTPHGLESTIVAMESGRLRVLRDGPVTREELTQFAPVVEAARGENPEAPGQLASHYAPRTPLIFEYAGEGWQPAIPMKALETGVRRGLLAWQAGEPYRFYDEVEILSKAGDLREAAATLFAKLRRLDEAGLDFIFAEPVPEQGVGVAIMDRLRKAAAFRE